MPRLQSIDIDPVDVDADGIAEAQTPSGAGNFTLDGALISGGVYTSTDGGARQVSFTSDGDESGDTYTVTGTDADGRPQTETVTGPSTTTVEGSKYWLTITQIATSGAGTGNITIGTVDELVSKTFRLNRHATTGALLHVDVTGTITYTAQVALVNPDDYTDQEAIPWIATQDTDLVATADTDAIGSLDVHAAAFRLVVVSYSSGAEVQAYISQGYK